MIKRLFIIEAPGKLRAFHIAAQKVYPADRVTVWATKGLIADLPVDESGIDIASFRVTKELLNRNGRDFLATVKKNLTDGGRLDFDEITVCTDPDKEGEHIAGQVYRLLKQYTSQRNIRRGTVDAVSSESISSMKLSPTPDVAALDAREFRRVTDRLIPLSVADIGQEEDWTGFGRVQFSILNTIKKTDEKWLPYHAKGCLYDKTGSFYVDMVTGDKKVADTLQETFRLYRIGAADSSLESSEFTLPAPPPATFASIFARVATDDAFPADVLADIQDAYMNGLISYPRSMTEAYTPETVNTLRAILSSVNLAPFEAPDKIKALCADTRNLAEEMSGHYGVHPTGIATASHILSLKDTAGYQTLAKTVLAEACASIMRDAKIRREVLTVRQKDNPEAPALRAERWILVDKGFLSVYPRLNLTPPYPQICPEKESPLRFATRRPSKSEIIKTLHREKTGQPSQVVHTLSALCNKGLVSSYMKLTSKGEEVLNKIRTAAPMLLTDDINAYLEDSMSLVQAGKAAYADCAKSLVSKFGLDRIGQAAADKAAGKKMFTENPRAPLSVPSGKEAPDFTDTATLVPGGDFSEFSPGVQ